MAGKKRTELQHGPLVTRRPRLCLTNSKVEFCEAHSLSCATKSRAIRAAFRDILPEVESQIFGRQSQERQPDLPSQRNCQ
jgi:hypothetical protein